MLKCVESSNVLEIIIKNGVYAPDMENVSSYLDTANCMSLDLESGRFRRKSELQPKKESNDLSYLDLAG